MKPFLKSRCVTIFGVTFFIEPISGFQLRMPQVASWHLDPARTPSTPRHHYLSLFDPEENEEQQRQLGPSSLNSSQSPRKFTGRTPKESAAQSNNRVRRDEFNLVSLATSPQAFLIQAAAILLVSLFVIYIGATGQLGINEDYFDDNIILPTDNSNELLLDRLADTREDATNKQGDSVWI